MKYNERIVEAEYHDEERFERNEFERLMPIVIEERGKEFEGLENCAIEFTEPRPSEPMKIW